MAQRENKAAWIVEEKGAFKIGPALSPEPDSHEVVIRAQATSIQQADAKIAKAAALKFQYPTILGSPITGFVEAIGSEVTKVKIGKRAVSNSKIFSSGGVPKFGGLQRFVVVSEFETVHIGETPFPTAVTTASQTSLAALFAKASLDLKLPTDSLNPERNGEKVLIRGGSSAISALSISYAKGAGYTVITTSSPRNFPLRKSLGADYIFPRLPSDIGAIVASIRALGKINHWFDCASLPESLNAIFKIRENEKDAIGLLVLLPPTYLSFSDNVKPRMFLFPRSLVENKGLVQWMLGGTGEKGYLEKGYEEG